MYAGAIWALVMYLFYYQRGNMQKSIDTSMDYLYLQSEHRPTAGKSVATAALASATESGVGGALYAVLEWCMADL